MAYTVPAFKTKKLLKEAVSRVDVVTVYSPGPFGCKQDGNEVIEGPEYPQPHRWYASVEVKGGQIVKVKS